MRFKKFMLGAFGALALSCFTLPSVAGAIDSHTVDSDGSFYVSGHYTADFVRSQSISSIIPNSDASDDLSQAVVKSSDGKSDYQLNYKIGHLGGIEIGYARPEGLRIGLEGVGFKSKSKTDSNENQFRFKASDAKYVSYNTDGVSGMAAFVNAYYDLEDPTMLVSPYVGVGAGMARMTFLGQKANRLAYQVKFGLSLAVSETIKGYFGYRYLGTTEGDGFKGVTKGNANGITDYTSATIKIPYNSHGVEVGLHAII